jgi:chromate transporter
MARSTMTDASRAASRPAAHNPLEVFAVFLRLGLTSFGGPVAHLGYFRREFVERRKWLEEAAFADLVGLCQVLPGPGSSQVGFAIGLCRAGWLGGLAAWLGFTLPSALLLYLAAIMEPNLHGSALALIHGLKIVAVAVVAQAVWAMMRALTPDLQRLVIAAAAGLLVTAFTGSASQAATILLGGVLGLWLCRALPVRSADDVPIAVGQRAGFIGLALFFLLLLSLPAAAALAHGTALPVFAAFYHAGALVFGGGHVVLPLLHDTVVEPGWLSDDRFLSGYGAAQAVPGPLFTVSAYLGASVNDRIPAGLGALVALTGIFLPGILILVGTLPFWRALRAAPSLQNALRGINAAVVGILAAALYDPLWTSAIADWRDVALAVSGFLLLVLWKAPPWLAVAGITTGSWLIYSLT